MKATFLFLGTGASTGVPVIGCKCAVCASSDPHNKRLRPSGLFRIGGKQLLVDVGPDFRQQALRASVDRLDGLLLTHTHFDHIAGIDELRIFNFREKRPFPCLLSQESLASLKERYRYLFEPVGAAATLSAQLELHLLPEEIGEVEFAGIKIAYCSYLQGDMKVAGFRIGNFAYVSDIRDYDDSIFLFLKGVKKLVVSALRHEASKLHFSIEEAVAFAKRVGAEMTYFTHMNHELDHEETNKKLPASAQLAFDGLEIEFEA